MATAQVTPPPSYGTAILGHDEEDWFVFIALVSDTTKRHVFCGGCGKSWLYSRFGPSLKDCPNCNPAGWNKS
jgi:hypothetical protein